MWLDLVGNPITLISKRKKNIGFSKKKTIAIKKNLLSNLWCVIFNFNNSWILLIFFHYRSSYKLLNNVSTINFDIFIFDYFGSCPNVKLLSKSSINIQMQECRSINKSNGWAHISFVELYLNPLWVTVANKSNGTWNFEKKSIFFFRRPFCHK